MTRKAAHFLVALTGAVLLSAVGAQAQPWTGAGPAATVDPQYVSIAAVNPQYLGFNLSGATGDLIARFNVTDTTATGNPGWSNLELGYFDNSPSSQITAALIQLNPCNGNLTTLCTVTSADAGFTTCLRCTFPAGSVNFNAGFTYYVRVTINRSSNAVAPKLMGVRVF